MMSEIKKLMDIPEDGICIESALGMLGGQNVCLLLLNPNGFRFEREEHTGLQLVPRSQFETLLKFFDRSGTFAFAAFEHREDILGLTRADIANLLFFGSSAKLIDEHVLDKCIMLYSSHDDGFYSRVYIKGWS